MSEMVERVARAIREEIVRQYREDDRGRCPAGVRYYEEHISPYLTTSAAIASIREPTEAMVSAVPVDEWGSCGIDHYPAPAETWRAMIDAALKVEPHFQYTEPEPHGIGAKSQKR